MLAGQFGTASKDPCSLELFRVIGRHARRLFTRIKAFYVGKEAKTLLDAGWRFTTDAKSPTLYDLKND